MLLLTSMQHPTYEQLPKNLTLKYFPPATLSCLPCPWTLLAFLKRLVGLYFREMSILYLSRLTVGVSYFRYLYFSKSSYTTNLADAIWGGSQGNYLHKSMHTFEKAYR